MKKILVAGGGIGGLTAALSLQAHGFQCEIFEQNPALSEAGAGIQISPNAMHVFGYLGLGKELEAAAFAPCSGAMRHDRTGKAEMVIPLKGLCEKRYGAQYLHIHRADLLSALKEAIKKTNIDIHFGKRAQSYEQKDNFITLYMEDGSQYEGDLIIGADGIHSAMRAQRLGHDRANFTGQIAWRGVVAAEKLPKGLIPPDANIWLGPRRHFVAYYLRGGRLVNFVAVEDRDEWAEEDWNVKGNMTQMRQAFAGWDDRIKTLLEACEECFLWGLFDHAPLPRWVDGRMALLGDACHPMLPFMAQGAAMAIEDGFVLARQLADNAQSLDQALASYEATRKPRATMLQELSRSNAKMYHIQSPIGRFGRKMMFKLGKLMPGAMLAQLDQIYGKNVTLPEHDQ